jgi:Family of unknown function (DUF6352)
MDFWQHSGYHLLDRASDGHLLITDDYLRLYYARPELAPVVESCAAELRLHQALLDDPRRPVPDEEIAALADPDAQENYRVMLRFRDRLLDAPTLESCYFSLFQRDVAVPPLFIYHTAEVILRGMLEGMDSGLLARAAEVFFRPQRVSVKDGAVMLADAETVDRHAESGGLGNLGRMLIGVQAPVRSLELDVLTDANHAEYFRRDERHDAVLQINPGLPGSLALCDLLARWVAHFHGTRVQVTPIREIPDEAWVWHVGLDVEASAMLNDIYAGGDVDEERMRRIVGLFRMDFADAGALQPELRGAPVFLGMAMTADGNLRMKPQNLLMNLPLARRA